jgi:hypothetical protein
VESDDKLLLAVSPDAVKHVINFMGSDCPNFQADPEDEEGGCELCAEVITDATAALRDHIQRGVEEANEGA